MYYNGEEKYDVAEFLNMVHTQIREKYNIDTDCKQDLIKAKKMTRFLTDFKRFNRRRILGYNKETIQNKVLTNTADIDLDFYENIRQIIISANNNIKMSLLFNKIEEDNSQTIGKKFEQEMGALLGALAQGSASNRIIKKIVSGKDTTFSPGMAEFLKEFKIDASGNVTDTLIQDLEINAKKALLEEIVPKTQEKSSEDEKKLRQASVYAKTDINAGKLEITKTWNVTPQTQEAISLLLSNTFSAKSYSSNSVIGIGATSGLRRYFSVLESFNSFSYKTISSSFTHALNLMNCADMNVNNRKNRAENTSKYIQALNYFYELRGTGQQSPIKQLYEADFLLYNVNDDYKNIYVIPTKYILKNCIDLDNFQFTNNPFNSKEINFNKTFITAMIEAVQKVKP